MTRAAIVVFLGVAFAAAATISLVAQGQPSNGVVRFDPALDAAISVGAIYCSGPGGIWIISPQGKHPGTIVTPERVANVAFGDTDSKSSLYVVGGRSSGEFASTHPASGR